MKNDSHRRGFAACSHPIWNRNFDTYPANTSDAWLAIVLLLTNEPTLHRLSINWPSWRANLLQQSAMTVPVLFTPKHDAWFESNPSWPAIYLGAQRCNGTHRTIHRRLACEKWTFERDSHDPADDTRTAAGLLLTCSTRVHVPLTHPLSGHPFTALRGVKLNSHCGEGERRRDAEYVASTKWYAYHLFLEPVLKLFTFWAKVDADVCFGRPLSMVEDVLVPLIRRRAVFFHSALMRENDLCQMTLGEFVSLYWQHHRGDLRPWDERSSEHASIALTEARQPPWRPFAAALASDPAIAVPYSNFVGGWVGFWSSERVMHFARLWWEWDGGWYRRWTDQQFWRPALWMAYLDQEAADNATIDLSHLRRTNIFAHPAWGFSRPTLRPGSTTAETPVRTCRTGWSPPGSAVGFKL